MNTKERIKLNSPKGIAKWPYLTDPCKTFDKEYGEFKTGLLLQEGTPECTQLMSQIDKWMDESKAKAMKDIEKAIEAAVAAGKGAEAAKKRVELSQVNKAEPPYAPDLDKTTGEKTGMIEFKFKRKAVFKSKAGKIIPQKIMLFDAVGNPLQDVPIYGGSTIRTNYTPDYKYMPATRQCFVKLQLNAVQVIELVSGGVSGKTADDFGFESEEGFIYEQPMGTESEGFEESTSTDF